ncbi:MAG TPA: hypothetical protein PLX33_10435 [Alphaproteobacteria bacterium]|nr:hypothetical protein [Alphaproteobacteria bacterium]
MTEGVGRPEDEISDKVLRKIHEVRRRKEWLVEELERDTDAAAGKKRMRVAQDKRLFDGIGPYRAETLELVYAAHRMIVAGIGWQTFNPFRTPGGGGDIERGATLMVAYRLWAYRMRQEGKSLRFVLDVAVVGMGLREAERANRMRSGTGLAALSEALDMFNETLSRERRNNKRY